MYGPQNIFNNSKYCGWVTINAPINPSLCGRPLSKDVIMEGGQSVAWLCILMDVCIKAFSAQHIHCFFLKIYGSTRKPDVCGCDIVYLRMRLEKARADYVT